MSVTETDQLQENYHSGYWEWDMKGETPFGQASLLLALGYTNAELQGDPIWYNKIDENDRLNFIQKLNQHVISNGVVIFACEVCFLKLQGKTQYFLFTGKVIKWAEDTSPLLMRIIFINTTKQKEAQKEILRLNSFLDKITQVGMVGGWELDMNTDAVTWSAVTRQIFGVADDFVPQKTSILPFFKEGFDRDTLHHAFINAITNNEPYDLELKIINTQGQERWTRTIGQPEFENGKCVRLYGIFQDITETKQEQEKLAVKNQQLEKFISAAPVSIAMFDRDMNYMAASHIWMASYNIQVESIIGKSHYEVFYELPEVWKQALQKCLAGEVVKNEEDAFLRRDGKQEWLRWEIRPWYEAADKVGGVIMFTELITKRKLVKEELIRAKNLAEEAAVAKSRFLSVMSHEIRTPMNAVIGFTNLLLNNPRPDQLEYLKPLKFSADNLMVIINDILSLSKADEGKIDLEKVNFSLKELFQNIYATHKPFADEKGLKLAISYHNKDVDILIGDQVRLGQIITNLVNNAIKFTAQGIVTVRAIVQDQSPTKTSILFSVEDTGIGIPTDMQKHVFELFTQASTETTRKYGGTGLGLAICQRLAELMGGSIHLQSTPGQGSVFSFTLQFDKGSIQEIKKELSETENLAGSLTGLRALITEDNPLNVLLLKRYLQQWGVVCDVAENGEIALTMVKLKNYDLILMDLQMPVMDGYETARQIRRLVGKQYARMPIIALTANVLADVRTEVLASGMDDCISKPFNVTELYNIINNVTKVC